jgi:dipeptidyl aminopeptidase/acylaminoacyl peptidase
MPAFLIKSIKLPNGNKFDINADIYHPGTIGKSQKLPCVIFAHGFKGFKDWGGFPYLMEQIAETGFAAVSFNFTLNGIGDKNLMDFTRLDLFAQNTHTKELNDLKSVIGFIYENAENYNIDKDRIGLIGHSRGGAAVIITASEDDRIKALVTLASVADVNRYTPEQVKRWREKGYIEIPNTRTNQMMRMNISFLEDIEQNSERLDIQSAFSRLKIPALIIHGKEDLAVKVSDAEKLYNNSDKNNTELCIIENTGHTFGIEHPFKGTTNALESMIAKVKEFFKKNL